MIYLYWKCGVCVSIIIHRLSRGMRQNSSITIRQTHLMWPIMTTSNQPLMETPKLRQSVNAPIEQARTDHTSMPDLSPQGHSKFCADEAVHHYTDNRPPPLLFEDPWKTMLAFDPFRLENQRHMYVQVDTVSFFLQLCYDMKVADVSGFVGISAPIFLEKLSWPDYSTATTSSHLPAWFTNPRRQRFTLQSICIKSDWLSASWHLFFGFGRTSQ